MPLRGQEEGSKVDDQTNSMRNVHRWVTSKARYIGIQVKNLIHRKFDENPELEKQILDSLGKKSNEEMASMTWMQDFRQGVAELLIRNRAEGMPNEVDVEEINENGYRTCIRGHLLRYWAQLVGDPGERCTKWTFEGAPAGLAVSTDDLDGYFPSVEQNDMGADWDDLATDYANFQNYLGVEDDDEALDTLEGYHRRGFLDKCNTLEELEMLVGGKPTLSKLGCLKKVKTNPDTGEVVVKSRIILDCKRSNVSKVASRRHKAVLPRVSDAIQSILATMAKGQKVTLLIADITDAFWLVPLRKQERKFFTATLRGRYYSFNRTAQGSRSAPLTFAALLAVAGRWIASASNEMHVQIYVDDPIAVLSGPEQMTSRMACVVIVMWNIMGFPIATHKAILSDSLVWIGVHLSVQHDGVKAEIPAEKVRELDTMLAESIQGNLVTKKLLRTLIGKAMSIASILFVWRPFISELYMALHEEQTNAPQGCVWSKQIAHAAIWLRTFLAGEMAGIQRIYLLKVFKQEGPEVTITWDASPYGMGGALQVGGKFMEFFAIHIGKEDEEHLSTKSGTSEGQQTWEALCGLICLRLWQKWWMTSTVTLRLRNDNVGALTLFAQVKGRSPAHTLLAKEFALDLGKAQYRPRVTEHLPGIVNVICDVLSRRFQPGETFNLPHQLKQARAVIPPSRPRSWWKTLSWGHRAPAGPSRGHLGAQSSQHTMDQAPMQKKRKMT